MRAVLVLLTGVVTAAAIGSQTLERTVVQPDFYVSAVQNAGVYAALTRDFVPQATRHRVRQVYPAATERVLTEAADVVQTVLTEDWFAAQSIRIAASLVPYMSAETEGVALTLPVADRLHAAGDALNDRLRTSPLTHVAYDRMMEAVATEVAERQRRLPFGVTAEYDTWLRAGRLIAPRQWVSDNVIDQLGHILDYLTGRVTTLTLSVPVHERKEAISAAIRLVVDESNVVEFMADRVVRPRLHKKMHDRVLIQSAGIKLTADELAKALDGLLHSEWVHDRQKDITGVVADYLTGGRDTLDLEVPLDGLKKTASIKLTATVVNKVTDYLKTRPKCTAAQTKQLLARELDPLTCRATGLAAAAVTAAMVAYVQTRVSTAIDAKVPSRFVYTEDAVRKRVGKGTWRLVQRARRWMTRGVVIHEARLRHLLHGEREDLLDEVLAITRSGFHYTQEDLTAHLEAADNTAVAARLNTVRTGLKRARSIRVFLGLAVVALVLLLIMLSAADLRERLLIPLVGLALGAALVQAGVFLGGSMLEDALGGLAGQARDQAAGTAVAALFDKVPVVMHNLGSALLEAASTMSGVVLGITFTAALPLALTKRRAG